MLSEFIDLKTVYTIAHVFGAILGAGGAFSSDAMFFSTIKDGRINNQELKFLKLGGKLVWIGLTILIISGLFLFFSDIEKYMNSTKFLAKVTIVGVIILNGFVFHLIHIPHIQGHLGIKFANSKTFMKKAPLILISGAISVISWIMTVILGSLRGLPFSYLEIICFYLLLISFGIFGALLMKRKILHV